MENVRKLEVMVASWYKQAPHLPKNGQKWLAENVWWLVLIGVILGAMGVFSLILATFFASALLIGFGGVVGAALSGVAFIAVMVTLAFSIVFLVIGGAAVTPLKAMQRKGWTLLFVIMIIKVAASAVAFLLSFNVFGLIWELLFAAVGVYFLFEIRDFFAAAHSRKAVTAKKKA